MPGLRPVVGEIKVCKSYKDTAYLKGKIIWVRRGKRWMVGKKKVRMTKFKGLHCWGHLE
jgi:hypothetical protein